MLLWRLPICRPRAALATQASAAASSDAARCSLQWSTERAGSQPKLLAGQSCEKWTWAKYLRPIVPASGVEKRPVPRDPSAQGTALGCLTQPIRSHSLACAPTVAISFSGIDLKNGQRSKTQGVPLRPPGLSPHCPFLPRNKWGQACGMARRSVSNAEKSIRREKAIEQKAVRNLRQILGFPGKSRL